LNVAAHETVVIAVTFAEAGKASILIVDRDGYVVRSLSKGQRVQRSASFGWDGRDDHGEVVPNEAYSLRVEWRRGSTTDVYFPADIPAPPVTAIRPTAYDRRTATLSYTIRTPSRVHIQAGTATLDPKSNEQIGVTMKTIVNREPRSAGAIAEHWSGFDESGEIFIPDLKNFIVAIAASPLPENSIITFGNPTRRFVNTIYSRTGTSLFTRHAHAGHHAGLMTADDVSPALHIQPLNARWSTTSHVWLVEGNAPLRLRLTVDGPTATSFRKHPATIERFIDGRRVGGADRKTGDVIEVPLERRDDVQRVSINWNSNWGPVAANTIQARRRITSADATKGAR
jgi:flagellar hook assembly protein FlgD